MRPQMTVTPQEPLIKQEPFSVPFEIDNTGYFSFPVDHVFVYMNEIRYGHMLVTRSVSHRSEWDRFILDRGEGKTIVTRIANFKPETADIAVVIDYRPFKRFPISFRRYFRFVGAYGDTWQWLKQPSSEIQDAAASEIDRRLRNFAFSR